MATIKRQVTDSEKQQVLDQQRRSGVLYCFVEDHPIEDEDQAEFHHIKPYSDEGPTEIANIGAVCKDHHRRIRTLSLSQFRDQIAIDRFFDHPEPRRLDHLLCLKLSANGFARPVTVDGSAENQLGSVSKLLFHGLREGARIRRITQRHGGRNNGSFVTDG